ncbi:glycosyltransferase family 2 protein [Cyanobium sp. FACHB-13342]|uniref:glycosyltransferase family 2 protein n=1 Tax=Cyanobium sp. FACHB-13342 TaxID=2692793 RepID=UPI0016807518|nr:glycosyltransferase family 2 protein [Cyanobium sp. FACHB-13342]MBD2422493.1 glycosyltransferase family 2 protein [Cyanobium sp. FACHB-13342]
MSIRVSFSLVLFRHVLGDISPLLSSIASLSRFQPHLGIELCIYNGSGANFAGPTFSELQACVPGVTLLYEKGGNIGFGRANNLNYRQASLSNNDIFIVANPDTSFAPSDLVSLLDWLISKPSVACVAPLVIGADGALQHSAKRNPTVLSLALGRFPCFARFQFLRRYDAWHKNLDKNYKTDCFKSPYLSGCFLIIPSHFYSAVGGFCPRFFLHLEDADLVRRLSSVGETLHNPIGSITHRWARGSHKSLTQSLHLLRSCITYFRIWGFTLL